MNNKREKVLDALNDLEIKYEIVEHQAVKTMEEMNEALGVANPNEIIKNLFLYDDKKKRFFLISVAGGQSVNLKELRSKLSCRPLSFASEERLNLMLGLDRGEVSPLGILNDTDGKVEVVFDEEIKSFEKVGIHPNDNTATLFLAPADLEKIVKSKSNNFTYIKF